MGFVKYGSVWFKNRVPNDFFSSLVISKKFLHARSTPVLNIVSLFINCHFAEFLVASFFISLIDRGNKNFQILRTVNDGSWIILLNEFNRVLTFRYVY